MQRTEITRTIEAHRCAVFLDRDGVLNAANIRRGKPYPPASLKELHILPDANTALARLKRLGFLLLVVTNQPGIALGRMDEHSLQEIHGRMLAAIRQAGGGIDAVYYCPHHSDACACRKPGIELFREAKREFPDIDFANSLVVGDSLSDLETAYGLGCRAVLIADRERRAEILKQVRRRALPVSQVASSLLEFSSEPLVRFGERG
jgi:D-glycero-D-manno-heptose 1,7-bisphosphate phosphatase